MDDGEIFTYALGKLDDRGRMFVRANDPVYEGMIVGIHNRDNDLVVNATRTKQLTNFRVSGKEDAIKITPPIELTLEYGVEFIEDDELVEITPKSVRLRKRYLKEHDRKRASRETALTTRRWRCTRADVRRAARAWAFRCGGADGGGDPDVVDRRGGHAPPGAARSFEVTFWRSFFTVLCLLVILPVWQGRGVFSACARVARYCGFRACAGAGMFTFFMVAITLTTVANVLVTWPWRPCSPRWRRACSSATAARTHVGGHRGGGVRHWLDVRPPAGCRASTSPARWWRCAWRFPVPPTGRSRNTPMPRGMMWT
jgi:hypothetical protein